MANIGKIKLPDGVTYNINAVTVNNHTVNTDVPSGAKFTDTTYSAGSNITLTNTTFSLTKANVTGALGYTPPQQDTTYSAITNAQIDALFT